MAEALVPGQWPGSAGLVLLEHASAKWPPWSQRGPGSTGIWKPASASRFPEAPSTIQSCSSQCIWLPRAAQGHSSPYPKVNTADLKSLHLTSHVGECYCLCDAPGFWVLFSYPNNSGVPWWDLKSLWRESLFQASLGLPSLTAHRATEPTQWAPHQGFLLGSTEKLFDLPQARPSICKNC